MDVCLLLVIGQQDCLLRPVNPDLFGQGRYLGPALNEPLRVGLISRLQHLLALVQDLRCLTIQLRVYCVVNTGRG
jgi:hypothetical protein